jgi:hypothetical protein
LIFLPTDLEGHWRYQEHDQKERANTYADQNEEPLNDILV